MNATHLRIISCPREGGEMTGYNPDQQPKCRLTESAFRDDRLKPFFSNLLEAKKQEMPFPAPGFVPQTQDRPLCPSGEARRLAAPAPSRERFRQAKPGQKLREDSLR